MYLNDGILVHFNVAVTVIDDDRCEDREKCGTVKKRNWSH
jgi:hypothetical protein